MRADAEADQYRAAQLVGGMSEFTQLRTILGEEDGDGGALSDQLQLEGTRAFDREIDRVGNVARGIAELNGGHAVAVNGQVNEGRIRIGRLAEHDDGFTVGVAFG